MTKNLPRVGGLMYVESTTTYGPAMNQDLFESDFPVSQILSVRIVPEEVAEMIKEVNEDLREFDYTRIERRERKRFVENLVSDVDMTSIGNLSIGYNLAVPNQEFEPGDVITLDMVDNYHVEGVYGVADPELSDSQAQEPAL